MSLAALGRAAEAESVYKQLVAANKQSFISPEFLARAALAIGRHDEAIDWLERGIEMHSDLSLFIRFLPDLAPLRADPRYARVMRSAGLPP
jgi:tetratricopeptide (TPR) repeat protein